MERSGEIEHIMDTFDFNKVHKVMTSLDWAWYCGGGAEKVPELCELRQTARILLYNAKENGPIAMTGGFKAVFSKDMPEGERLSLCFMLEESVFY